MQMFPRRALTTLALSLPMLGAHAADASAGKDWPYYHGNPGGTHYSTLEQINTSNVGKLQLAWSYDTGDSAPGKVVLGADMEVNPLIIAGKMYALTPKGRVISLDGATGRELWVFDPADGKPVMSRHRLRGVSYWTDGKERRILVTFGNMLYALNADTGRPMLGFGDGGKVDLRVGMDRDVKTISVGNVSPGAVYRDLLIMGSTGNTPGHIRAFDVRTGSVRWIFHTIPHPGEYGYDTWPKDAWKTAMGANNWTGMTVDPERGIVYVPLASGGMGNKDFYGADRHGDNLYGNALVALDAATGKHIWHYQTVRHDIWDRDLPAPPTLITVRRDGKTIPAVAQTTKSGFVFVFDRVTGAPLFPIDKVEVWPSDVPGELAADSQVLPRLPAPFSRQRIGPDDITRRTPEAHADVSARLAKLSNRGPFDPPSEKGSIILAGLDGGAEWGGSAYDPQTGLLYVNANEMAWVLTLKKPTKEAHATQGRALYLANCASCHHDDRSGSPPEFPSLVGVGERLPLADIAQTIQNGKGRMPGFGQLKEDQIKSMAAYLAGKEAPPVQKEEASAWPDESGSAFVFDGYNRFLDADGYPALSPPWGTLSAINMNTGKYAWKIPFGTYPELAAKGMKDTGSGNYGGAVVTAGGLLFIAATQNDNQFHAFDKRTGKLLWQTTLPTAGLATPATYEANGRQFVVIAAGGGKNDMASDASKYMVYALPLKTADKTAAKNVANGGTKGAGKPTLAP
jgi:quinoprotein glucose dehydrogenase